MLDFKKTAYHHYNHYFKLFASNNPDQFYNGQDYVKWFFALPAPIFNAFMLKEGCKTDWEETIRSQSAFFYKKKYPSSCFLTEHPDLNKMSALLNTLNYHSPGPFRFLKLDLCDHKTQHDAPGYITVKKVESDTEMHLWADIISTVFFPYEKEKTAAFFYLTLSELGYESASPIWHYIGYLNEKPIGVSSLLMTYDNNNKPLIAGLWNGGVLEEGRRQGVGRAMAFKRIEEAKAKYFPVMTTILMSEAMAWSYCKPLGFTESFHIYPYFSN